MKNQRSGRAKRYARRKLRRFITHYPVAFQMLGDMIVDSLDWHGAARAANRLKELLPPERRA
jgi:hypothetical protein